jgi:aminoglycoside phosphotransferase (APT) family kinase protein
MPGSDAVSEAHEAPFEDPLRRPILDRYGIGPDDFLGRGGEANVFALDAERVLRLYRSSSPAAAADYVRRIGELYDSLDRDAVPFALPQVHEVHEEEVAWSIERRLPGQPLDGRLDALTADDRRRAIDGYVDGAAAFAALGVPPTFGEGYGELFTVESLRADTWADLLAARLQVQLELATSVVSDQVPDFERAAERVIAAARTEPDDGRTLVHGDYFPGNVLLGEDLRISAVLDFGWLTVVGDPTHDVRSAVAFWEVRPWSRPGDSEALVAAAQRHLGPDARDLIARTRQYEQLRFAFVAEDPHLFAWCVEGLRSLAASPGGTVPADGP